MNIELFEFLDDLTCALPSSNLNWVIFFVAGFCLTGFVVSLYCAAFYTVTKPTPAQILEASIVRMQKDSADLLCPQKDIYYQLIDTLKAFLKHELFINVDSKMDAEIPDIVAKAGVDAKLVSELNDILQRAYRVRFAHLMIDPVVMLQDIVWLKKLLIFASEVKAQNQKV